MDSRWASICYSRIWPVEAMYWDFRCRRSPRSTRSEMSLMGQNRKYWPPRKSPLKSVWTDSLRLDACRFDDRPPFLDLSSLKSTKGVRCLVVAGRNLLDDFGKPLAHFRAGQRIDHRGIEPGDDVLRRTLRDPQPVPD